MNKYTYIFIWAISVALIFTVNSCVKEYVVVPEVPVPKVGVETSSLESSYISSPITSVNDPYWSGADFLLVDIKDIRTGNLYSDGILNATGSYDGILDFNQGNGTKITLRSAYDDEYVYILAEWDDVSANASKFSWLWNGPLDPLKADNNSGWTSQRNSDHISFAFDINGSSNANGTFLSIGCAAACHVSSGNEVMGPTSGKVDLWNWSLSLSEPLGYAFDMWSDPTSLLSYDNGQAMYERNSDDPSDPRSGPKYEWDGATQTVNRPDGVPGILDPAHYLLNKTNFIGDPAVGSAVFMDVDFGCEGCHGEAGIGYGTHGDGPPFNNAAFSRKFSRTSLDDFASSLNHEGNTYYNKLTPAQKDDLLAYIRGLAGVPGYFLVPPAGGESISDIQSSSDILLAKIPEIGQESYKVLFKRKLMTGNNDDIQFDLSQNKTYVFGVALMDNDGINHVGSLLEQLIFKDK